MSKKLKKKETEAIIYILLQPITWIVIGILIVIFLVNRITDSLNFSIINWVFSLQGFLFIALFVFLIIAFIMLRKNYSDWKREQLINSETITKIKILNNEFKSIFINVKYSENLVLRLSNKNEFDRKDTFDYFYVVVGPKKSYYLKLFEEASKNKENYEIYINKANTILNDIRDIDYNSFLFRNESYKKELFGLARSILLKKPITQILHKVSVEYSSPTGRNTHRKYDWYKEADIISVIEQRANDIEIKQTYEYHKYYERSLMNDKLRFEIFKRDNYKCKICGRSQNEGSKLHVDHIIPVSKGGKTLHGNLQTLCENCNLGKSDSYM